MTDGLKPYQIFLYRDIISDCFAGVLKNTHLIKQSVDDTGIITLQLPSAIKLKNALYKEFKNIEIIKKQIFNVIIINTCKPTYNTLIDAFDVNLNSAFFISDRDISANQEILDRAIECLWADINKKKLALCTIFKINKLIPIHIKSYSAKNILYILYRYILSSSLTSYHIKNPDKTFFNDSNKLYKQSHINKSDTENCITILRRYINEN